MMIKLYASFKMRGKAYNRFPTLNEWINIERGNRFAAANLKKEVTEQVRLQTLDVDKVEDYPILIHTVIHTASRFDVDNLGFCLKFILDGLQKSGVLENDSQKFIVGYDVRLCKDKEEFVELSCETVK